MKRCILFSVLCFLCAVLLPIALFQDAMRQKEPGGSPPLPGTGAEKSTPSPSPSVDLSDEQRSFSFLDNGTVRTMTMAEYLPGVVAGEMPAAFDMEALRSQAVAGRTYAL